VTLLRLAPLFLAVAACDGRPSSAPDAGPTEPSPNASILPAPLATGLEQAPSGPRDAGTVDADADAELVVPEWPREDRALGEDLWEPSDLSGLLLAARFRWPDVAPPVRLPEANADALARLAEGTRFDATIELSAAGRLRFVFSSKSFALPRGSELRARTEALGHVVVWPDRTRYAVIQPGTLRAVLNERRADAESLSHAKATAAGEGQAHGFPTEKSRFTTSFGRVDLEQARVAGAGGGGVLLCRSLLEMAGIHPDAPVCSAELVPVRAEYAWSSNGRLAFEVTSLLRVAAVEPDGFAIPPRDAEHRVGELPDPSRALLAGRAELRALRNKAAPSGEPRDGGAPKEGLLAANGGDLASYLLVDGVPVAHLAARGGDVLLDLVSGTYAVQARDFLATEITVPIITTVPARFVVSEAPKSEP
jgi:hypothetical protein